jgi:hypothetical protein
MHLHNFVSMDLSSKEDNTVLAYTLCQDIFSYLATESMHVYHDIFQIVNTKKVISGAQAEGSSGGAAEMWRSPRDARTAVYEKGASIRTSASLPHNLSSAQIKAV